MAEAQPSRELADVALLAAADKRHSHPAVAGASRSTDPVDVCLVIGGWVEVDHMRDALDVDPAGSEVGRDERVHMPGLEA